MGNRIESCLQELKQKNEKAFITYITAGLPDMDKTAEIIKAQEGIVQIPSCASVFFTENSNSFRRGNQ